MAIHLCRNSNAQPTQGKHPEMDCRVAALLAMTKQKQGQRRPSSLRGAEGDVAIHLCRNSNARTTQGQHPEMDCRVATLLAMTTQISDAAIHLAKVRSLSFAASMRDPVVYIMASKLRGTLYTGVTSNLPRRAYEHREGLTPGFTKQYGCKTLVWYEPQATMPDAIAREKQIKAGSRADKIRLIEAMNFEWRDLYEDLA